MNCTPESSISFKSNWQLSSQHSYTNVPINININVTYQTVLSTDEQNIQKLN